MGRCPNLLVRLSVEDTLEGLVESVVLAGARTGTGGTLTFTRSVILSKWLLFRARRTSPHPNATNEHLKQVHKKVNLLLLVLQLLSGVLLLATAVVDWKPCPHACRCWGRAAHEQRWGKALPRVGHDRQTQQGCDRENAPSRSLRRRA